MKFLSFVKYLVVHWIMQKYALPHGYLILKLHCGVEYTIRDDFLHTARPYFQ